MADEALWPPITEENTPFWHGARRGELRMQRCADTGRLIFPPRETSPWGNHAVPEWETVSGRGRIWSFVVPHPPLLPPFDGMAPYNVILVEITAYSDDNAYSIFESMNDRGLNLTSTEMLKGYILSRFGDPEDREKSNFRPYRSSCSSP